MSRPSIETCRNKWQQTANDLREITGRIESLTVKLILTTGHPEMTDQERNGVMAVLKCLNSAENELSGLSYLCTPQTEWTGGDSSLASNHVVRIPHIVNDRK